MTCVKRNMTELVKETCQLSDLINTKLPEDSVLTLSDEARDTCLGNFCLCLPQKIKAFTVHKPLNSEPV